MFHRWREVVPDWNEGHGLGITTRWKGKSSDLDPEPSFLLSWTSSRKRRNSLPPPKNQGPKSTLLRGRLLDGEWEPWIPVPDKRAVKARHFRATATTTSAVGPRSVRFRNPLRLAWATVGSNIETKPTHPMDGACSPLPFDSNPMVRDWKRSNPTFRS